MYGELDCCSWSTPMTLCAHYCRDRSYANECFRHGAEEFRPLGRLFSPALSSCRLTDRSRLPFREVVKPSLRRSSRFVRGDFPLETSGSVSKFKQQVSLKSCPRNQRHLQPSRRPAGG